MTLEDCLTIVDDEAPVEIRHDKLFAPIKGTAALDNDNIFSYVITAVLGSGLCVVIACGLETLMKAGVV